MKKRYYIWSDCDTISLPTRQLMPTRFLIKMMTIDSIFGIFCFHHFKDPFNFLKDVQKKLKVGGLMHLDRTINYSPFAGHYDESEYFNITIIF